ncbi:MAG: HEAT repeat domain-containing protein [Spirochaetes bacterium]|nr:HEAT repeat domain-containing protein [Spirochaetota bacterium]
MTSSCGKKIFNGLYIWFIFITVVSCSSFRPLTGYDALLLYYENGYKSDNWKTRLEAIQAVATIKGDRAENLIIKALEDSHIAVKVEALHILSKRPIKRAHAYVKDLALYSNNDNIRWEALKTLSRYRDPRDAAVFIYNFSNEDWLVREASIVGLLSIDDYSTKYIHIDSIIKAMDDSSISVKLAALAHLTITHPALYNKLILMLSTENNTPSLIVAILKALQAYTIKEKDRDKIVELLTHSSATVRIAALQTLKNKKEL